MKKYKLVFILINIVIWSTKLYSQNEYYDALRLKADLSSNKFSPEGGGKILFKYFSIDSKIDNKKDSIKALSDSINQNPFFKSDSVSESTVSGSLGSDITQSLSAAAALNVTTVADGIAKFLVDRTKEELSVAFFTQLKADFDQEKYAALQTLFPRTYHQLDLIGDKIYQFSTYLTDLRNAFIADLNDFATTMPYVINLPQYQKYFAGHPWVAGIIQMGFLISSELIQKNNSSIKPLANIIADISDKADTYFPAKAPNQTVLTINGTIKTFELISSSLRSADSTRSWITSNDFFKLINDDVAFKIYLGLLYQRAKNISVNNYPLTRILDSIAPKVDDIQDVKNTLSSLVMQMNLFDEDLKTLKTMKADSSGRTSYYYALFNTSTEILLQGMTFIKNINDQTKLDLPNHFFDNIDEYTKAFQDVSNLYLDINQKRFALAISSATDFFTIVLKDGSTKDKSVAKFIQKLSTYGTFIAGVANAKNSNDVDSIITQTVLPTGSSSIKKHSIFNIALQAYTGLYGGWQQQATDTKFVGAGGVMAPIGIAASWGFKTRTKKKVKPNPGSFSIFASIVDLGPLVSFRFSDYNDVIANNIQVRLAQIVSPGVHLVFGLPKIPISLGLGGNWAPLLTNIEKNSENVNTANAFRLQAFIAVDLPLINFYNNPR